MATLRLLITTALAQRGETWDAAVHEIRKRYMAGEGRAVLARSFGVTLQTVYAVAYRKNWAWLPEEEDRQCQSLGNV